MRKKSTRRIRVRRPSIGRRKTYRRRRTARRSFRRTHKGGVDFYLGAPEKGEKPVKIKQPVGRKPTQNSKKHPVAPKNQCIGPNCAIMG